MNAPLPLSATSPANACALPEPWIEKLFQRFEDFYGSKWAAQYGDFPRERVKRTWAEELAGFRDMPKAFAAALQAQKANMFPPTLPEFLALCRNAAKAENMPSQAVVIDAPKADPVRVQKITEQAAQTFRNPEINDYHACWKWARKKWLSGDYLYPIQIANASSVLREVWEVCDGVRTCRSI